MLDELEIDKINKKKIWAPGECDWQWSTTPKNVGT